MLKVEKIAHACFASCSKAYITFDYGNMDQIQNIASILDEHGLLATTPSVETCLFEEPAIVPKKQAKTKGNNNLLEVDEFVFLNVILGRDRFYAVNRGIRKQLHTNDISTYSMHKEAISGIPTTHHQISKLYIFF